MLPASENDFMAREITTQGCAYHSFLNGTKVRNCKKRQCPAERGIVHYYALENTILSNLEPPW